MAGRADFTPDQWLTMQRAMTSAGYVVALSEGGVIDDMLSEILAVTQRLSGAGRNHPNQLVRELASMPHVQSGLRPELTPAAYEQQSLAAIRASTVLVAEKAPGDLESFRAFLVDLAEAAANAHRERGFLGTVRVTAAEKAAIVRVKKAMGLQ